MFFDAILEDLEDQQKYFHIKRRGKESAKSLKFSFPICPRMKVRYNP